MCDERQSTQEGMADVLAAIREYYPGAAKSINSTLLPTAQAQLAADQAVSPGYAQLNMDLYNKFGPEAAKTASNIDDITQRAASQRELDLARSTGNALVTEADLAQRKLDPEFYAQRENLSGAIGKYLKASDPSLTEGEREEIRRGVGRTAFNPNSAIDTATAAMNFGQKSREKTALFGDAISRVAAAIPSMRSGISGFEVATRRNIGANTGDSRVGTAKTDSGNNTYGMANNFMNIAGNLQQQRMSQQKSGMQNASEIVGMVGKFAGGVAGAMM